MRPNILTIAGFDPSGGAGILADVKTFEQLDCQGFAVQTANTVQSEDRFQSVNWVSPGLIAEQLDFLLDQYQFDLVKVGVIENLDLLLQIMEHPALANTRFIWDPVLRTSGGFDFQHKLELLDRVLGKTYLIIPNADEVKILAGLTDPLQAAKVLSKKCKVYLKGGHLTENVGTDYLIQNDDINEFLPEVGAYTDKHGSGCVLSSAVAAFLSQGQRLEVAVENAKRYVERYLVSTNELLGAHRL